MWIAEQVGGSIVSYAKSKALAEVTKRLGIADPTTADLENHLVAIQNQLTDLKADLDKGLQQLKEEQTKLDYDLLVQKVDTLKGIVATTENTLIDVLKDPSRKDYAKDQLSKYVYPNVLALRNAWEGNPVIRNFLLGGSSGSSSAYKVLSNMITGSRDKIFTWRDSAYMDSLFRSALDLQAVQFNLIVQMRIAEDTSPATVYQQDAKEYLGSEESAKQFFEGHASMPASGWLHEELVAERKQLPKGAMVDTRTGLMWSTDIPGGSRTLTLNAGGKGVPVCTGEGDQAAACVGDPHYSLGPTQPAWNPPRWPGSAAEELAKGLAAQSLGSAQDWNIPTLDQVKSLFSTYQSSKGSAQAWLEARSGGEASKCAPQSSLGQGSENPDACLWPQGPLWTSQLNEIVGEVREVNCTSEGSCQPPGGKVVARIPYGWHFDMFDLGKNGIGTCDLVTPTVDWSRYKDHGSYSYWGPKAHPDGTQHCTAGLVLVRKLSDQEQSQYYF